MDDLQRMIDEKLLHGQFSIEKAGHPPEYWYLRKIFLDCRGDLRIHPDTNWGWQAMVLTRSHDIESGEFGKPISRRVWVDEGAWVCARAVLYNCHIKHHAIVACGAVVRNMTVEPYTIVEGNPAVTTRVFLDGEWRTVGYL